MKKSNDKKDFTSGFGGMRLLNPAQMSDLTGGIKNLHCGIVGVYLCAYEIHCSSSGFTYDCSMSKFSATCGAGTKFTIAPKECLELMDRVE